MTQFVKRVRQQKLQPEELAPDNPVNDFDTKLKIILFNYVKDVALAEIQNEFILLPIVYENYVAILNLI